MTGIWTGIPAMPKEAWIQHVVVGHPGVVVFLVFDMIILIAATTLTAAQASQVTGWDFIYLLMFPAAI